MAYREGRSPYDIAFDIWTEAQTRESQAAIEKADAAVRVAEVEASLELAWARLGAVTALERHLNALKNAAVLRPDRLAPGSLEADLASAVARAEQARDAIKAADGELALARQALGAATDALGEATRARMTAETELRKLTAP